MTDQMPNSAPNTNSGVDASAPVEGQVPFAHDVLYGEQQQSQSEQPRQAEGKASDDSSNSKEQSSEENSTELVYEFKPPEGKQFDPDLIKGYEEIAREAKLAPKDAQKVLDKMGPLMEAKISKHMEETKKAWVEAAVTDKEYGGEKLHENLSVAKKAIDHFGNPPLRELLEKSGLGNNPEVIRFMYKVGKSISEDGYVGSSQSSGGKSQPMDFNGLASALYSNQPN